MSEKKKVKEYSLYYEACQVSHVYQKQLVGRLGQEFSDKALQEWNQDHWWAWAAKKALEHLNGEVFWVELGHESFGCIGTGKSEPLALLEQYKTLQEQLEKTALLPFRRKEELKQNVMNTINQLLDTKTA